MPSRTRTTVISQLADAQTLRLNSGTVRSGGGTWTGNATMTDVVSPGYFKAKRRGLLLPVNPMSRDALEINASGPTTLQWTDGSSKWVFTGNAALQWHISRSGGLRPDLLATAPSMWPEPSDSLASMLQEALANARSTGWDILTFAKEFDKTAEMFRKAGTTFNQRSQRVFDYVGRFKHRSGKRLLDAFMETWLEYRFGWRTLAYDVQDMQDSYAKLNALRSDMVRKTVYKEAQTQTTSAASISQMNMSGSTVGGQFRVRGTQTKVYTTRYRAGVGLDLGWSNDIVVVDPFVTAYEVIPYSFLVDYFFNVGDVVSAWSPFAKGSVAYAFTSVEREVIDSVSAVPIASASGWTPSGGTTSYLAVRTVNSRSPATPTVDLSFRPRLNKEKVLDIVALIFLGHAKRMKGLLNRR